MLNKIAVLSTSLVLSLPAAANICGTDFQNFNPTTSGLDFVTVHSSETLKPCILNLGIFLNYAANTLSYSQTYPGSVVKVGEKAQDRILGADLSMGIGLTKNWDVGVSFPFVVSQEIKDTVGVTYYDKKGLTEFKLNSKFRFYGNDSGGIAGVVSLNDNLIQDNPFTGSGAGPTVNLELAADRTYKRAALGVNVGYRKRTPGDVVPNQPFVPLKDQYIYSIAGSFLLTKHDTKIIAEVFGSSAVKQVDYDANRSLNSLEWLAGIKHDLTRNMAFHVGGGTQIANSIGSPDWRVYTGLNWALGPICNDNQPVVERVTVPDYEVFPDDSADDDAPRVVDDRPDFGLQEERFEGKLPVIYRFNAEVFFDFDSDRIKTIYIAEIENLIRDLASGGFKRLGIDGHTDSMGTDAYNIDLSRRRAESVKRYLVDKYHALPNRIFTKGYGERRPIADNGNYQGRQKNRRVEFKVWK